MSEVEAAYMAEALAEGRHMTEGGMNQLVDNQTIYVEPDPVTGVYSIPSRVIPLGDGRYQVVTDSAYISTLERALVGSHLNVDQETGAYCQHCEADIPYDWDHGKYQGPHAPDCIVPALIAKYPDA